MKATRWRNWLPALLLVLATTAGAEEEANTAPKTGILEKAGDGFKFTEGPTVDAEGAIYFTDQPNDRIHRWTADGGIEIFLEPAGRSNGLCIGPDGMLWACADGTNELWKIDPATKEIEVMVSEYDGKRLNGPNDVWVAPNGHVYFTDPFYKRPYWTHRGDDPKPEQSRALYHLAPDGTLTAVDTDLKQPNGIVGSSDGKRLYVADINAGRIYRYRLSDDGSVGDRQLFCRDRSDGMTLDTAGNLYITNGKGVTIYSPAGHELAVIEVPSKWTANVAFGGPERKTLFVTATTGVYTMALDLAGDAPQ